MPAYDVLRVFELMHEGKMNGYFCQGFNPLLSFPNRTKITAALSKLKFLVVMDPLQTETARFSGEPRSNVPVILPEPRRLRLQRIHDDEELELGERVGDLAPVRERHQRIEALAEVAVHLAVVHQLEHAQHVVGRHVELGQPVIGEIVRGGRRRPHIAFWKLTKNFL